MSSKKALWVIIVASLGFKSLLICSHLQSLTLQCCDIIYLTLLEEGQGIQTAKPIRLAAPMALTSTPGGRV